MLFAQVHVQLFPEAASTLAEEVDALFFFILGVAVFFTLLIAGMILIFIVRYRRRSPNQVGAQIEGSLRLELFWTIVPLLIALGIFVWGARVYMSWAEPPDGAMEVYVVGRQWMWQLQHDGGQKEINELHVPVGRPVRLTLTSQDVIHSFFVPDFRLHMDAIPGRYTATWFQATSIGKHRINCSEYCGTNHSAMIGYVHVVSEEDFRAWLSRRADQSLATRGMQHFQRLQCVTCHSADAKARAPILESIYLKSVPLQGGTTVIADEDYLRESIRKPNAKIVAGFHEPTIMPVFGEDVVTDQEMLELIAFLRSLGPGQTPRRVEDAAPPAAKAEGKKQ